MVLILTNSCANGLTGFFKQNEVMKEIKYYKADMPEITLKYKKGSCKMFKCNTSQASYLFFKELFEDTQFICEQFAVLYLNMAMNTIGWQMISKGSNKETVVNIPIIVKSALDCAATSVIIAHNHTSGEVEPSSADKEVTRKLRDALNLFDAMLCDHIIVGEDKYLSFADNGLL